MSSRDKRTAICSSATDVRRAAILESVRRRNAALLVLSAPGGYGKSVTASQIAAEFQNDLWISMENRPLSMRSLAESLVRSMQEPGHDDAERDAERLERRSETDADAIRLIQEAIRQRRFADLCIVLDAAGPEASLGDLHAIARTLREAVGPRSMLVVTARDIAAWRPSPSAYDILILGSDALALSLQEARSLAGALSGPSPVDSVVDRCYEASQGQAALFDLLIRHPDVLLRDARRCGRRGVPETVRQCLRSLISTLLEPWEAEVLWCAALLSEGEAESLVRCVPETDLLLIEGALDALAAKLPLLRVVDGERVAFRVHDLVLEAFDVQGMMESVDRRALVERAILELVSSGRYGRALYVADRVDHLPALVELLEECGRKLPPDVSMSEARRYLSRVPAHMKIERPILVYLEGHVLQQAADSLDALARYELAEKIASSMLNAESEARGLIGQGILLWNTGRLADARACALRLRPLLSRLNPSHGLRASAWELMLASDCVDRSTLQEQCDILYETLTGRTEHDEQFYQACSSLACVYTIYLGDFTHGSNLLNILRNAETSGRTSLALGAANLAMLLLTAGRVDAATKTIDAAIEESRRQGATSVEAAARQTKSLILATGGRLSEASPLIEEVCTEAARLNRTFELCATLMDHSMVLRAAGEPAQALEKAESACAILEPLEWRQFRFQAHTERLASRLALGDEGPVYDEGLELRRQLEGTGHSFYLLRLDMVLAEIERRRGSIDSAASRIAEHAEQISGEGSNWHMAMYTRAFPGLLGIFARALGAGWIPIHMLRLLQEPCASKALEVARGALDPQDFELLVLRTLGKKRGREFLGSLAGSLRLRVRLFGGLSVETPAGVVPDRAWRKRKARLLFAMLAMSCGRDVPRDVIFERLWPGMPAEKAQSNFYVTWSYMKKALSPGDGPCPYLEHRGGVCRVVPEAVQTDLAEFFEAADALRKAKARGDRGAVVAAAERMAELHAGELLAGDLYEDWCAETRERARHELSDAMLAGAEALADSGAPERAVRLVRHALAFDPWREDLYQAALRYQIMAGQRSSAIETYMACRSKLADDLGLDPSQETQRLYEQVLAMEDAADAAASA